MDKGQIRELLLAKDVTPKAKFGTAEIEPLIKLLNDIEGDVRDAAAAALAKIGEPAVAPLIKELKHSLMDVKRLSAAALSKMARGTPGLLEAILPIARHMEEIRPTENYQSRRDIFFEIGRYHRQIAANIGEAETMALLVNCFKDEKQYDRELIITSLIWIPETFDTSALVEPLLPMLADNDENRRRQAASILSRAKEDIRGLRFKKIIHGRDKEYALRIGLKETARVISEFMLHFKEGQEPQNILKMKSALAAFYAEVVTANAQQNTALKMPSELLPARIKQPKRKRDAYRQLRRMTV